MNPKRQSISVIGAMPYELTREDCHAVKRNDFEAIGRQAKCLAAHVPTKTVLIPVPGHEGYATHTLLLSKAIALQCENDGKTVLVWDALEANSRPSLCELKQEQRDPSGIKIQIRWKGNLSKRTLQFFTKKSYKIILVDNVIDTGKTVLACQKTVGPLPLLVIGDTYNHKAQ